MVVPTYDDTPRLLPDQISPAVSWMAWRLVDFPLAGAGDLGDFTGLGRVEANRRLQLLKEVGLVDCVELGWSRRRVARWWLTDYCLALMEWPQGWSWHDAGGRAQLLQRLPVVESLYSLAAHDFGLGPFREFRWIYGESFQAAARYRDGWAALFWSGIVETRSAFVRRLQSVSDGLQRMQGHEMFPVPAVHGIAVGDRLQREVVVSALHDAGLLRHSVVWSSGDEQASGLKSLEHWPEGGGWLSVGEYQRDLGSWAWSDRVRRHFGSQNWGSLGGGILDRAWEWPGMGSRLAVGTATLHYGRIVLREMVEEGFLVRERGMGGKDSRYGLGSRGVEALRRRDGGFMKRGVGRYEMTAALESKRRIMAHEDGLMDLMGRFQSLGLEVHNGKRCFENIVGGKAISPDGVLWLENSPYGPGWHYVEYERYANRPSSVENKLRGYVDDRRRNSYPVLFVLRSDRMEGLFQEAAQPEKLAMVTTTLERLKRNKAVGSEKVWSLYGKGVALG